MCNCEHRTYLETMGCCWCRHCLHQLCTMTSGSSTLETSPTPVSSTVWSSRPPQCLWGCPREAYPWGYRCGTRFALVAYGFGTCCSSCFFLSQTCWYMYVTCCNVRCLVLVCVMSSTGTRWVLVCCMGPHVSCMFVTRLIPVGWNRYVFAVVYSCSR